MSGAAALLLLLAVPSLAPSAEASPPPQARPLGVVARAERGSVRLGEPFRYTVELRHRAGERYVLREPALAPFTARPFRCRREAVAGGEARTTCTSELALFALGPAEVPELVFEVEGGEPGARLSVSGPRITAVGSLDPAVPPESVPLRDLAPPVPLLVRSLRLVWWLVGAAAALGLLVAAARALRRVVARRRAVPALTPQERLARRLAALAAQDLPGRGRGDEHLARLAEAVREYLGALALVPALELTTAELLAALRARSRPDDDRLDLPGLERLLCAADLSKFARAPAGPEDCAQATAWAGALLERTRPAPGVEPRPAAAAG